MNESALDCLAGAEQVQLGVVVFVSETLGKVVWRRI